MGRDSDTAADVRAGGAAEVACGATLSVRAMARAVSARGAEITKSQVGRDYQDGAPQHDVQAYLTWRLHSRELGRTGDSRIDRPQANAEETVQVNDIGATGTAPLVDENTLAFRQDRARNERLKADRAEIELQQLRGELVSVRSSEEVHFTSARITRDRVLMVAPRFAGELHAMALSVIPEEQREAIGVRLDMHTVARRLEEVLREALDEAAQAIADSGRDDDDDQG